MPRITARAGPHSFIAGPSFGRMLKKSASGVLASRRGSPYGAEYDSPLCSLRPCWAAFLSILRKHSFVVPAVHAVPFAWLSNSFSAAC